MSYINTKPEHEHRRLHIMGATANKKNIKFIALDTLGHLSFNQYAEIGNDLYYDLYCCDLSLLHNVKTNQKKSTKKTKIDKLYTAD